VDALSAMVLYRGTADLQEAAYIWVPAVILVLVVDHKWRKRKERFAEEARCRELDRLLEACHARARKRRGLDRRPNPIPQFEDSSAITRMTEEKLDEMFWGQDEVHREANNEFCQEAARRGLLK
jgi:hypothetical protein